MRADFPAEVMTGRIRQQYLDVYEANSWYLNKVEPQAWLTDVLERMISGRTKAHKLERLLPWAWKPDRLAAPIHA